MSRPGEIPQQRPPGRLFGRAVGHLGRVGGRLGAHGAKGDHGVALGAEGRLGEREELLEPAVLVFDAQSPGPVGREVYGGGCFRCRHGWVGLGWMASRWMASRWLCERERVDADDEDDDDDDADVETHKERERGTAYVFEQVQ